jgi:hypothetical protein
MTSRGVTVGFGAAFEDDFDAAFECDFDAAFEVGISIVTGS